MERIVANAIYNQGISKSQIGDITSAKAKIIQAVSIVPDSLYWRSLAEISIANVNQLIAQESGKEKVSEVVANNMRGLIADSVESARRAVQQDQGDYQNWFTLGRVYEILAVNGIEGGLDNAKANFLEAQKRSPSNPAIELALARISALNKDIEGAKARIARSLSLKSNYTDAYFYLAQIEIADNNIKGAIKSVEAAAYIDSSNAALYFQLGLLKYNQLDYAGARSAFERAIELAPDYANAKYFLGLSYNFLNKKDLAIKQFEELEKSNPDNAEIKLILENLKANKKPFVDAKPPVDSKPEKRTVPPIEEN